MIWIWAGVGGFMAGWNLSNDRAGWAVLWAALAGFSMAVGMIEGSER